jgi:hypothetical protein
VAPGWTDSDWANAPSGLSTRAIQVMIADVFMR